jgi:hypothetical protein
MRSVLAFLVLACLTSSARADRLDAFCSGVRLPSAGAPNQPRPMMWGYKVATCTDPQLRALALDRLKALDETNARLDPFAQQALGADEGRWVGSYAASCGIKPYAAPALPLTPEIKNCMVRAVEGRIAYIRSYSARIVPGPSFDERIAMLQPGHTTEMQAIALLGTPIDAGKDGDVDLVVWVIGSKGVGIRFGPDGKMITVQVVSPGQPH